MQIFNIAGILGMISSNQFDLAKADGDVITIRCDSESAAKNFEIGFNSMVESTRKLTGFDPESFPKPKAREWVGEPNTFTITVRSAKDSEAVAAQIQKELSEFNRLQKDASAD